MARRKEQEPSSTQELQQALEDTAQALEQEPIEAQAAEQQHHDQVDASEPEQPPSDSIEPEQDTPAPAGLQELRTELDAIKAEVAALRSTAAEVEALRSQALEVEQQAIALQQAQQRLARVELERDAVAAFVEAGGLGERRASDAFLRVFADQLSRDAKTNAVVLRNSKGEALPVVEALKELVESDPVVQALMRSTSGSGSGSVGRRPPAIREDIHSMSKRQLFAAWNT